MTMLDRRRTLSVLLVLGLAIAIASFSASRAKGVSVNVLATKMVIDPPSGRMTFSPARPGFNPGLTVETAIERVRASDPLFSPPTNAVAYLGLYTEAVGDGTYRLRNQPAWGLTWKDACPPPPSFPSSSSPATPVVPVPCTTWVFLDATTGDMLEGYIHFDS